MIGVQLVRILRGGGSSRDEAHVVGLGFGFEECVVGLGMRGRVESGDRGKVVGVSSWGASVISIAEDGAIYAKSMAENGLEWVLGNSFFE